MSRKTKRGSGIYEYLTATGVLATGTSEEIAQAKKEYWATIRKECKRKQRQSCKGYTVLFTQQELKHVSQQAKHMRGSITQYIKQAALSNGSAIDKKAIGEIRQGLALHYMAIQNLSEENKLSEQTARALLEQVVAMESMVKEILVQK